MTVPIGDRPGAFPALLSTLVEFREAETGRCLLADQLDPGASYDAILTTPGGFYRYDIGDRFRCVDLESGCARLVFEGRADVVSDMVGEKLDEAFVARVLASIGAPARLEACAEPRPCYRLVLGTGRARPDLAALDRALAANPQYAHARKLGQLGPLIAARERWDSAQEAETRARAGQRLGDVKPTVLVPLAPGGPILRED